MSAAIHSFIYIFLFLIPTALLDSGEPVSTVHIRCRDAVELCSLDLHRMSPTVRVQRIFLMIHFCGSVRVSQGMFGFIMMSPLPAATISSTSRTRKNVLFLFKDRIDASPSDMYHQPDQRRYSRSINIGQA